MWGWGPGGNITTKSSRPQERRFSLCRSSRKLVGVRSKVQRGRLILGVMLPGSLFKGQAGEGDSLGHVQRRWKTIIAPGRSRCLRGCLGEVAVEVEG